eukprot:gene12976-biopygen6911
MAASAGSRHPQGRNGCKMGAKGCKMDVKWCNVVPPQVLWRGGAGSPPRTAPRSRRTAGPTRRPARRRRAIAADVQRFSAAFHLLGLWLDLLTLRLARRRRAIAADVQRFSAAFHLLGLWRPFDFGAVAFRLRLRLDLRTPLRDP